MDRIKVGKHVSHVPRKAAIVISGLVYRMLGIPDELFTPLFAVARMAGWAAHRMEEMLTGNRIIRPAYKAIAKEREYVKLEDRE